VTPTVLPIASRALVESCRRLGLDGDALLAAAGIPRDALEDPDARLESERADALWRAAYEASGDPLLALRASEATPFGSYRVIDYLGVTGPTLGEGLRRVAAFFPIVDPRGVLRVVDEPRGVALVFTAAAGGELPPPAEEYTLGVLWSRARHAAVQSPRLAEVRFSFPRPADVREHARIFGIEPRFGASAAALVFERATWNAAARMSDPALFALLDRHARSLAEGGTEPDDLAARTRIAIAAELPGREPKITGAARRLGTSARTLQRRLAAAGTTFARIVDDVRRERAEAFLRAGDVSVAEVSWLVGFSEQSAFTRAFRRWTGMSPTELRRAAARPPAEDVHRADRRG
jgi:AraC-like DNA-binding protein